MPQDPAKSIFLACIRLTSPEERASYLEQAGNRNPAVRRQVDALLQAHDIRDSFLENPALPASVAYEPLQEKVGSVIGPYKLR